jgi:hypothetical protein
MCGSASAPMVPAVKRVVKSAEVPAMPALAATGRAAVMGEALNLSRGA